MNQLMERPPETEPQAPEPIPQTRECERRALLFVAVNCRSTQTDAENLTLIQRHATLVRDTLGKFKGGEEIGRFGESFFIQFSNSAIALRFSLQLQANIRALGDEIHRQVFEQISMDFVEVPAADDGSSGDIGEVYEKHAPVCRALAGLTKGNQILLTNSIFDELRLALKKEDLKPFGAFSWQNHGPCQIAGIDAPVEVGEIREGADVSDNPPAGLQRVPATGEDEMTVWGWRPGPGSAVPGTRFVLDEKLADGRFGEEWSAGEPNVKEKRLFKFCVRKDWLSQLKEQEAVFQSVRKKVGQNPNVLAIQGLSFDQPPYYVLTELFEGKDLLSWSRQRGGAPGIPFPTRLELMAQVASGLQAAHEGRILHRCLRPENILVAGSGATPKDVQVKLANFGVGHVALAPRPEAEQPPHEAHPVASGETPPPSPEDMYKAPEVIAGQEPNTKSEVYSLAVILCQLILGNLSEPLTPKRMTEIVTVLKRDGLASLFAADPQARADGVGRVAGDLRAAIKEREARVTWQGQKSRREMIEKIVMISLSAVALIALAIFGPKYLLGRRQKDAKKDEKKKPGERASAADETEAGGKVTSEESRDGKAESEEEEASGGGRTRHRPAGAVRDKKKEEVKQSAESFFNFVVLPIGLVIIIGTVIQQFGPKLKKRLHKAPPPTGPEV